MGQGHQSGSHGNCTAEAISCNSTSDHPNFVSNRQEGWKDIPVLMGCSTSAAARATWTKGSMVCCPRSEASINSRPWRLLARCVNTRSRAPDASPAPGAMRTLASRNGRLHATKNAMSSPPGVAHPYPRAQPTSDRPNAHHEPLKRCP